MLLRQRSEEVSSQLWFLKAYVGFRVKGLGARGFLNCIFLQGQTKGLCFLYESGS